MDAFEKLTETAKALSHPGRMKILHALLEDEACVCHLEHLLGFRQAYISQQLKRLKEGGLVKDEREGLNVYYSLADESIRDLLESLRVTTENLNDGHPLDLTIPHDETDCPCPKCSARCCSD